MNIVIQGVYAGIGFYIIACCFIVLNRALAWIGRKNKRIHTSIKYETTMICFLMTLFAILAITIGSNTFELIEKKELLRRIGNINWSLDVVSLFRDALSGESYYMINTFGNILMFIPYGFFMPIVWRKLQKWYEVLLVCLITSGCIEGIQLLVGRASDVSDIILNAFGGVIGWFIYRCIGELLIDWEEWRENKSSKEGEKRIGTGILILEILAWGSMIIWYIV